MMRKAKDAMAENRRGCFIGNPLDLYWGRSMIERRKAPRIDSTAFSGFVALATAAAWVYGRGAAGLPEAARPRGSRFETIFKS
jgi:hypothetical protein